MFRPANQVTLSILSGEKIRAKAFGLNRLAINLGMAIGPMVGGLQQRITIYFSLLMLQPVY